jgi:serine/threonine protein kinase
VADAENGETRTTQADPGVTLRAPGAAGASTEAAHSDDHATISHGPSGPSPAGDTDGREPPEGEVGRFRILRPHARGGLGLIYVARDEQLGREVALKEIQPQHAADSASRARFLLEAEVTGALEHPGVVPIYALGRHPDGRPFYAMRLVRGETLKEAIARLHATRGRRRRLDEHALRALVRRLMDVANAMAYAHSRGVLHRDLKPANILLGPYGETLIVDWGLAKVLKKGSRGPGVEGSREVGEGIPSQALGAPHSALGTDVVGDRLAGGESDEGPWVPSSGSGTDQTLPGRAVGTPAFMSPEQAAGALDRLGPATDVYSLGATLYALLTGRPPFDTGEVQTVLVRVQQGDFPRPRAVESAAPRALEAICRKAMARRPEDRYPDMRALADDLERWLDDEPVSAHREGWPVRLARWARRHRTWTAALVTGLLAIYAVMGLTAEGFRRSAARERAAREQGLRVAAKFAARTVAAEIDRRWRILEAEADDPAFVTLLARADAEPLDSPAHRALQAWLADRAAANAEAASAANWFLADAHGLQIARSPYMASNIGVDYSFRDYFHGQGRDLPRGTPGVRPIDRPHRSIVFRSMATGALQVVFSVPVRDTRPPAEGSAPDREGPAPVLGVLGMSVDLGQFRTLQLDLGDDQVAVLADLRPDANGRRGLILHHPWLGRDPKAVPMIYLDAARVESLEALRRAALARHRGRDRRAGTSPSSTLPGGLDPEYRDPVGEVFAGPWLAAFEPVLVEGRPDLIDDTGWVVIVQERADAND